MTPVSFSPGILLSVFSFCYTFVQTLKKLPQKAEMVSVEVESLEKKLDWIYKLLEESMWMLEKGHKEQLEGRCAICKDVLEEANATAKELKTRLGKAKAAATAGDVELANLAQLVRVQRDALDSIMGEISLGIIRDIKECVRKLEQASRRVQYDPVAEQDIPSGANPFTKYLLTRGLPVDVEDPELRQTPLHTALYDKDLPLVTLLLDKYANPGVETSASKHNAAHIAAVYLPEILPLLRDKVVGSEPLREGRDDDMRKRSQKRTFNARRRQWIKILTSGNKDGMTPLHLAVEGLSCDSVDGLSRWFFFQRELATARDRAGRMPLHTLAVLDRLCGDNVQPEDDAKGRRILRKLLASKFVELDSEDKKGCTALDLAEKKNNQVFITELKAIREEAKRPKEEPQRLKEGKETKKKEREKREKVREKEKEKDMEEQMEHATEISQTEDKKEKKDKGRDKKKKGRRTRRRRILRGRRRMRSWRRRTMKRTRRSRNGEKQG